MLGVREVQSNHCLSQSRACPTRRVKKRFGSMKSKASLSQLSGDPLLKDYKILKSCGMMPESITGRIVVTTFREPL